MTKRPTKRYTGLFITALLCFLCIAYVHGVWVYIGITQDSYQFEYARARFESLIPIANHWIFGWVCLLLTLVALLLFVKLLSATRFRITKIAYWFLILFTALLGILLLWQML